VTKLTRGPRLMVLVALTALAVLALATAGSVAAAPGSKGKAGAKGYKLSRGATTVELADAANTALKTAGVTVSINKPAKAGAGGNPAFPVTNGRVKGTRVGDELTNATGKISHTGGLTLTQTSDGDTISLRNLRIVLDADPDLTAVVVANGVPQGRQSIADLEPGTISFETTGTKKRKKRWLVIEDTTIKLNTLAVTALNGFFGTTFAAGDALGEADTRTRIVGRFPA
jgi:hypothetical protein